MLADEHQQRLRPKGPGVATQCETPIPTDRSAVDSRYPESRPHGGAARAYEDSASKASTNVSGDCAPERGMDALLPSRTTRKKGTPDIPCFLAPISYSSITSSAPSFPSRYSRVHATPAFEVKWDKEKSSDRRFGGGTSADGNQVVRGRAVGRRYYSSLLFADVRSRSGSAECRDKNNDGAYFRLTVSDAGYAHCQRSYLGGRKRQEGRDLIPNNK